jgi:HEAT repeat protein
MDGPDPVERAAAVSTLGHAGRCSDADAGALASIVERDDDARVRIAALGSLVRAARRPTAAAAWQVAAHDAEPAVRRRAAELAPSLGRNVPLSTLLTLLDDADVSVAEAAAFALGERQRVSARAIERLVTAATDHRDPLVRESAVAALGAIGDERGLPAVLRACDDRPAIRRRAVLALAAFDGDEVEDRIRRALEDPDWQVRQAAEDLLNPS